MGKHNHMLTLTCAVVGCAAKLILFTQNKEVASPTERFQEVAVDLGWAPHPNRPNAWLCDTHLQAVNELVVRCWTCGKVITYPDRDEFFRCDRCGYVACTKHAREVMDLEFCPFCGKEVK